LISNEATALDSLQFTTLPLKLPGFLSSLGFWKVEMFTSRLSDDRDNPHAWFSGVRLGLKPTDFFEANFAMAYFIGGRNRPTPRAYDVMVEVLGGRIQRSNARDDITNVSERSMAFDWRWNLKSFGLPVSVAMENYIRDCCGSVGDILEKSYGYSLSVEGLLSDSPRASLLRADYSRLPDSSYWFGANIDGWSNSGRLLGASLGRDSDRVSLEWRKPFGTILKLANVGGFFQRRLRAGTLVREDIRGNIPDFAIERAAGAWMGLDVSVGAQASIFSRSTVVHVWNRRNSSGRSSHLVGLMLGIRNEF
jgi:hypothetical protein